MIITPARACLVISDNGEERLIDCPKFQEVLDELHEVRRDGSAEVNRLHRLAIRRDNSRNWHAAKLRQAIRNAKFLILWGCMAPTSAFLVGLVAGGFLFSGRP